MNSLYLDMDGVLADFNAGVESVIGYKKNDINSSFPEEEWKKITKQERIYRDLPLMKGADDLVTIARKFRHQLGWHIGLLTAIPKDEDMPWVFNDKFIWAKRYYPDLPIFFGPHSWDKHKHCKPGDILVDDRKSNCEEWTAAGGFAMHVTNDDVTAAVSKLEDYLFTLTSSNTV